MIVCHLRKEKKRKENDKYIKQTVRKKKGIGLLIPCSCNNEVGGNKVDFPFSE